MDPMILDPDQEAAVEKVVNEPTRAVLNASQFGTGKTLVTVESAQRIGGDGVILIAAPLFTKHSWASTILRQHPTAVVQFINSSKAGKAAMENMLASVPGWYIIGREYLASKRVREQVIPFHHKLDVFIYDECARWANYKSAGWTQVMKRMRNAKFKMALSATPAGNKFTGLFTITHWLWPKYEGHDSYWTFVADHCETHEDWFAGVVVDGEKNPGHYVASLPCYVRLEKDFGEPLEAEIKVELSPRERAAYNKFEDNLILWLGDNPMVAKFPIVKRVRLRQMTLGELAYDEVNDEITFDPGMKSTKYEALKGLIAEYEDEPMVIFTESQKYANLVVQKLVADGYAAAEWSGKVNEKSREEIKRRFMDSDGVDYIVATVASIGEGVDGLQARSRFMVWLSRSDNNQLNEQAFRRLYRRGQDRQVISVDIVAMDTYDEGVLSNNIEQALRMNRSLKKDGELNVTR
jgi:superfamily II DNA or RNA helicase